MRYNQLGNTGLFVSEICLGTMTFGGQGLWQVVGDARAESSDGHRRARARSRRQFHRHRRRLFRRPFRNAASANRSKDIGVKRSDVVIATKFYGRVGKGPNDIGASRGHIMDAVERSLERLQTDHIDLYQIHAQDSVTPVEETVRALDDLVSRGLVRYVGCSNWQAWKIMKALGIRRASAASRASKRCRPTIRSPAAISNAKSCRCSKIRKWAAGVESAGRWLALRKIRPGQQRAGRRAPHGVRFSAGRQGSRLGLRRRHARNRRRAGRIRSARGAGLCARQTVRHIGHHRRQDAEQLDDNLAAANLALSRGRDGETGRSQRFAGRISGLDAERVRAPSVARSQNDAIVRALTEGEFHAYCADRHRRIAASLPDFSSPARGGISSYTCRACIRAS